MVSYSYLLNNFPQFIMIHTVKVFGLVNEAEVDVFLELSCFLNDPMDVGYLISGSSAFSKSSLSIWKFSVHVLFKPSLKDCTHYLTSMWNECNCTVVWTFFGTALLQDWNENWPFLVLWPPLSFPNLLMYYIQHLTAFSFRIWNSSAEIPSLPLDLLVTMHPNHFMGNRWGNSGNSVRLYVEGLQNHCRWWLQP